jgi:hypothetical protein
MSSKAFEQSSLPCAEPTEEDLVTTLINPFYVFSGTVSPEDFIEAQKDLIKSLGIETYSQVLLTTLHKEVSSLIEDLKLDKDNKTRPNVPFVGNA